jgi:dTDP-4-amino-4,6-dideoxygalactose transaminase
MEAVPMARPTFGPEEEAAVLEVMRSGRFAQGERVQAFEAAFAVATGARHAVATSSGTTALFLALACHGIRGGDEVITSPLTFIATGNAIVHAGARPVFADVDDTLCLDPESVAALIGPRTRAIVPVHLHGNPANMPALAQLAAERGVALIQDACQAVGARVAGRPLGAYGTAVYSLYATKNITTGEGGMVTTDDPTVADRCARLRHQAYTDQPYMHDATGFNFRMTELAAAIGLVQLGKLDTITDRRRQVAAYYDETIRADRLYRPQTLPGAEHVYHQYTLRTYDGGRDALRETLREAAVSTGIYYPVPVHWQPTYRALGEVTCPVAELAATDMLSIPVHHALSDAEVEHVAGAVAEAAGAVLAR